MALATRCPHCDTVFRLDWHLLAPHDGRVRCGHCQEVFDAAHHRFQLPEESAVPGDAQHAAIVDDEVAVGPGKARPGSSPPDVTPTAPIAPASATAQTVTPKTSPSKPVPPKAPTSVTPEPVPAAAARTIERNAGASASADKNASPRPLDLGAPPPPPPLRPGDDNDRTIHAPQPEPARPAEGNAVKRAAFNQSIRVDAPAPESASERQPAPRPADPPAPAREAPATRFRPVDDRAEPFIGPAPAPSEPPRAAPETAPAADWGKEVEPGFGADSPPSPPSPPPRVPGAARAASANEAFPVIREQSDELDPPDPEYTRPRTGWRAAGIVLSVLLALSLIGQIAWWQRESLMVYAPYTRSLFVDICDPLGCTIAPPRYIDGLQIESSGLRQVDGPHKLELKLSLRNRSDVSLAYPALELTLLDDKSNVAVRRVLWPQDYARPGTIFPIGLPPQSAQPVVVRLDTGDAVAANYRVQVFYP